MKILVVEDDAATASYVADSLRQHGHAVDVAGNGRDGLFLAADGSHDMLIVDRMLPGIDGIALVKTLRGAGGRAPVLFLSARGSVADRVIFMDAGEVVEDATPEEFFTNAQSPRARDFLSKILTH